MVHGSGYDAAPPMDIEPPAATPEMPPPRVSAPRIPDAGPADVVHDTPRVSSPVPRTSGATAAARASAEVALADAAPVFRQADAGGAGKSRMPLIVGAVVVIAAAAGAFVVFGRKGGAPTPAADTSAAAAPARDTSKAAAAAPRADSAATPAAAAAAMGWLRVSGDLPDDAIIWVDSTQKRGRTFELAPGSYNLEIETNEFEPWERRFTVRAGDTTRVRVELELKADSTQQ